MKPLVVRGEASPEEIAAVLAALAVLQPRAGKPEPLKLWGVRRPLPPGPGAWRASGLP
ncbi:MAG TPA: acyl-CoA carboxylase epsilon subunit [Mycobacteriales bacterium]|nr:acyl-CoA carboxylase epsilon subunit [Mycobacteriales bacterium]